MWHSLRGQRLSPTARRALAPNFLRIGRAEPPDASRTRRTGAAVAPRGHRASLWRWGPNPASRRPPVGLLDCPGVRPSPAAVARVSLRTGHSRTAVGLSRYAPGFCRGPGESGRSTGESGCQKSDGGRRRVRGPAQRTGFALGLTGLVRPAVRLADRTDVHFARESGRAATGADCLLCNRSAARWKFWENGPVTCPAGFGGDAGEAGFAGNAGGRGLGAARPHDGGVARRSARGDATSVHSAHCRDALGACACALRSRTRTAALPDSATSKTRSASRTGPRAGRRRVRCRRGQWRPAGRSRMGAGGP
mmetsp:Transcript_31955/g.79677  ORF Transcript_31955/g.79677 Transcript_31955/m.79677 type:complete len:307 (+) Transcript_31955:198-1118(+)